MVTYKMTNIGGSDQNDALHIPYCVHAVYLMKNICSKISAHF